MRARLAAAITVLAAAGMILAQTNPTLTVQRDDSTMVITNYVDASEGGRTTGGLPRCEEGLLTTIFYGPPDGVEMVIDGETTIRSSLFLIRRPEGEEAEGQETIEVLDGQVTFQDRPPCVEEFEPAQEPQVLLEQGRTTVTGSRFFLDRETDEAQMEGPIALERTPEGEAELLEATSQALNYHLDSELSTLTGGVRVISGDRVSEADTLVLDEEAGLATLTGDPAVSMDGEDRIAGQRLLYYLDSNDVVVLGGVEGSLEVDLE